jgi:hypothetical protein
MFTANQHTFFLTTAVTVSSYDLLNLYLTKWTLAVEKCLTNVCNCNALFQIKWQSKSVIFVNAGYVTNRANRSFDLEAIRNLPSQEFKLSGFIIIPKGTVNPFRHSGYYMYHVVARSKTLFYVHIMNSLFVWFAQQTEILALHSFHRVVCITEKDSVYSAVGNKPLNMQLLLTFSVRHLNAIKSISGRSFLGIKPLPALQQM